MILNKAMSSLTVSSVTTKRDLKIQVYTLAQMPTMGGKARDKTTAAAKKKKKLTF